VSDESTAHACVVCRNPRRIPNRPPVCDGCREALCSHLGEIPTLFARLDSARIGSGTGPKVSGSKEPPLPLNEDNVDLALPARIGSVDIRMRGDWALKGGDPLQVGYLPIATELDFWVRDWITHDWCPGNHLPAPTVSTLAGWLRVRLDDACDQHPAIDEFAGKLKSLRRALVHAVGDIKATGERVGRCPTILRDDTRCGATLHADPYVDQIQCARCGTSWERRRWLTLAAAQDDVRDEGEAA
jgi:hypothetical protein